MSATAVETGHRTPVGLLTVVIVGDDVVRGALKPLLDVQDDMWVVAEADTAWDGAAAIARTRADVAIVDARLPDSSGYELCRAARERHPATRVLMLTSFGDHDAVLDAIRAGAAGYVLKHVKGLDLPDQVRRVAHAHRRPTNPVA
jgi:two-component system response regulator DevR